MSRIGRMPIAVPSGVQIKLDDHHLTVNGPKGELQRDLHPEINLTIENGTITVTRPSDSGTHRALHDLTRALVATEIVFSSDVFRAGVEWETVTGLADQATLALLPGLERVMTMATTTKVSSKI